MSTSDPYLTTAEVAERYRTAESTIRYWRHAGEGPKGVKIGRKVLYRLSELERWEQEQAEAEAAEVRAAAQAAIGHAYDDEPKRLAAALDGLTPGQLDGVATAATTVSFVASTARRAITEGTDPR